MFLFANKIDQDEKFEIERRLALEYLADAWNNAEQDGLEGESIAHAALFAAIATLVKNYGEESVAELIAKLPQRIKHGEYTLNRSIQ